jgi:hypothetical protein
MGFRLLSLVGTVIAFCAAAGERRVGRPPARTVRAPAPWPGGLAIGAGPPPPQDAPPRAPRQAPHVPRRGQPAR